MAIESKDDDGQGKERPVVQPQQLHAVKRAQALRLALGHHDERVPEDHRRGVQEAHHGHRGQRTEGANAADETEGQQEGDADGGDDDLAVGKHALGPGDKAAQRAEHIPHNDEICVASTPPAREGCEEDTRFGPLQVM